MSNNEITEDLIRKYKEETGKNAQWRGKITENFKKWRRGEKIYREENERVCIIVSNELKFTWQKFAGEKNISTISKLIRNSVDYYMKVSSILGNLDEMSNIVHNLKEPLTSIKGFTEMLMNDYKNDLSLEIILKLKDILDQSLVLEKRIDKLSYDNLKTSEKIDLLIVEDDFATLRLLSQFFKGKGLNCKMITNGKEALEFLETNNPDIILLDILLPDMSGYDICEKIKDNKTLSNIPLYYITAVPEVEVKVKAKETGAEGYILKPFNFEDFNVILEKF